MGQAQTSDIVADKEKYYWESHDMYFEDFTPGHIFQHSQGRKVTELDTIWHSAINMQHTHQPQAETRSNSDIESGRTLVSSLVIFSIVNELSLASAANSAIENLGWKNVSLPHPVYVGDTLYAESKILAKSSSETDANQGLVKVETKGVNQKGAVCLLVERSFLIPCRSQSEG